jgi:hypothetical protein
MGHRAIAAVVVIGFSLLVSGCAVTQVQVDTLADFHQSRPKSILIVPVVNKSIDIKASTSVLTTLPRQLGEKGYYVFPVNTVKALLEFEGLSSPQEVHNVPPAELASLFHADSILYVTIHSWTSKYIIVSTTTEVDIEYRLVAADGALLWADREKLKHSPDSHENGTVLSTLLLAVVESAIERADPNYLPLTRQANAKVFWNVNQPFPPGPYAPGYFEYYQDKP